MRASQAHQTVSDALMVMREAYRDQTEVGVNPDGNLVYVNPNRKDQGPASPSDPKMVRIVLAAKIEQELAAQWRSLDELRRHIKSKLPSLAEIDFKPENLAIPLLHHEWEELLKETNPVRRAEFVSNKRVMARREKFVDFLRSCLPSGGAIIPFTGYRYETSVVPPKEQQEQILEKFKKNDFRKIDTRLNISAQLVTDSHRQNLQIHLPAIASESAVIIELNHATPEATAAALRKLTERRRQLTRADTKIGAQSPQDIQELADKRFMQVLSRLSDQTLLNILNELIVSATGNEKLVFSGSEAAYPKQLTIDQNGNPVITLESKIMSRSVMAYEVSSDELPLESPQHGTPVNDSNWTIHFKAVVTIDKTDAEQGKLRARFIGEPEVTLRMSPDWQKIDQVLARAWQ